MKKIAMSLTAAVFLLIGFWTAAVSQTKEEVGELLATINTVKSDLSDAYDTQNKLENDKAELLKTDGLLKEAARTWKVNRDDLDNDISQQKNRLDAHDSYSPDQTSQAAVDAYNAEAHALDTETDRLKQREDNSNWVRGTLVNQRESLNQQVTQWAQDVKDNNDKLNKLTADLQRWLRAYQDLMNKSDKSKRCADIPNIEQLDLTNLNGAAERAARCLQEIWDGAN